MLIQFKNNVFLASNPQSRSEAVGRIKKEKDKDGGFKLAPDGRLIIKDSDNDSDDEPVQTRFQIPGLSDSGTFIRLRHQFNIYLTNYIIFNWIY